jgi:hypothetical protein
MRLLNRFNKTAKKMLNFLFCNDILIFCLKNEIKTTSDDLLAVAVNAGVVRFWLLKNMEAKID